MTSPDSDKIRNRTLGVIAALLGVAALKWSYPVTMPLAAAAFILAVVWPLKPWFDRRLPAILSHVCVLVALAAVSFGFLGLLYFAIERALSTLRRRQTDIEDLATRLRGWAETNGMPELSDAAQLPETAALLDAAAREAYAILGYLGLVAVLVILAIPEAPAFRRRLISVLDTRASDPRVTMQAIDRIARRCRQYVGITTLTSVMTGLACWAWAHAVGLELALIWGLLNFLLNYIPVVGALIGIAPPALYAILQFGGWETPLLVFAGFAVIQVSIGNFVYPAMQGRGMALPSVTIILALAFWGWVWGAVGALLAVPLTAALTIAASSFDSTAWIARLVARDDGVERQPDETASPRSPRTRPL